MSAALEAGPSSASVLALLPCQVAVEDSDRGGGRGKDRDDLGGKGGNTTNGLWRGNAGMRSKREGSRRKEGERKAMSRHIKRNKQLKHPAWKTREEETGRAHSLKISEAGSETDSEAETNLRPKKILKRNQRESRRTDKLSQQIHLAS